MSRASDWSRLLRHASDRLNEVDDDVCAVLADRADNAAAGSDRRRARVALASFVAAVVEARLVMDMLASFLVDGEETDAIRGGSDG